MATALEAHHRGLVVEPVIVSTRGDRLAEMPLDRLGGQGAFVKEVQLAVLEGRADAAVHSAKDLPSQAPPDLVIGAVPERADPRDALVGGAVDELPPGGIVATGSVRRRAQLANWRPDLTFVELRGNMATRLARAADGSVHAVVVALAALERLQWTDRVAEVLSPARVLPQVGQGALAVECRRDRPEVAWLLSAVDDPWSHRTLDAERSFLAALGGSCAAPVAGWAEPEAAGAVDGRIRLHAMIASPDGRTVVTTQGCGDDPHSLGTTVADHLMERCGGASVSALTTWVRLPGPRSGAPDGP